MKKLILILILALAISTQARKFYIDYAAANNSANGTSTSTPWKVCPYMQGWNGTYTHAAGDSMIFKGGVTWPNACFVMSVTSGGSSTHWDYYGVDKTWYTGGAWARPIFDMQATMVASNNQIINISTNYIVFDNFEITNFYWTGAQVWAKSHMVQYDGGTYLTFENFYMHSWTHGTAANGTADDLKCFCGKTSPPFNPGTKITHCVFEGEADHAQSSGYCCYAGLSEFSYNTVTHMPEGPIPSGDGTVEAFTIHDNLIYDMYEAWDPTLHENAIEALGSGVQIYNNLIYNCQFGDNNTVIMDIQVGAGSAATTELVYNNVVYGCQLGGIPLQIDGGWSGGHDYVATSKAKVFNNTFVTVGANTSAIRTIDDGYGSIDSVICRNNHLITDTAFYGKEIVTHYIRDHNLLQTAAAAATNGFSSANNFAPTGAGCSTIDAGVSEAAYFTTDILGVTRPQGSTWDIGAYEYGSGAVSLTASYAATTAHRGTAVTITPTTTGSFSSASAIYPLPAGLSITAGTGVISGTPTVKKPATNYPIVFQP